MRCVMKTSLFFFLILIPFLYSCTTTKQTLNYTPPVLISQTPLPPFPPLHPLQKNIFAALHIDSAGNVTAVKFLKGSLTPSWDSLAAQTMKSWKFLPAIYEGKPTAMWYRYQFSLFFAEPKLMHLAEIVCDTKEQADSLYNILRFNDIFSQLATLYSRAETRSKGGYIGEVNIYTYPKNIWELLEKLHPGEITPPIPYGLSYIIFKRLAVAPL